MEIGEKHNKLTCIAKGKNDIYKFKCECGAIINYDYRKVACGSKKHCGSRFIHPRHITFGYSHTRIDIIYKNMIARCYKPINNRYRNYGARGIKVCEEWKNDKTTFFKWAFNNGYNEQLTLDRINVNGNYEPSNCRWATRKQQARNTTQTRFIKYNNCYIPLQEYGEIKGLTRTQLWKLVKNNKIQTIKGAEKLPQ